MSLHQLMVTGPFYRQHIELTRGETLVGRHVEADVYLEDAQQPVSRRHARLTVSDAGCTLQDLGSTNGTRRNGELLPPQAEVQLNDGDLITIGRFTLRYQYVQPTLPAAAGADVPQLSFDGRLTLEYLPAIYHASDDLRRFLALLESVQQPLAWTIHNFDLWLHPDTAPDRFLPWLAGWFGITFDESWRPAQRRALLREAHWIYKRLGTAVALQRVLEIYTERPVQIDDQSPDLPPHTFQVRIDHLPANLNPAAVRRLIDAHKPAHTSYTLIIEEPS